MHVTHNLPILKETTQVINLIQEHETHYFSCSFTCDLALCSIQEYKMANSNSNL